LLPGSTIPGRKPYSLRLPGKYTGTVHGIAKNTTDTKSLVTYLLPATALVYGVTLLGESLTVQELIGMVLILGGVALGSGAIQLLRREPAPATPAP